MANQSLSPKRSRPPALRGALAGSVRVPLAILRTGIKLLAVLPSKVSERLVEGGIDLSALRDLHREELVEHLRELHVDVDSKNGDKVRIFCE